MKVPAAAQKNAPWQIAGYDEHGGRESELSLDVYRVRHIRRYERPVSNATRATEPLRRGYRFELVDDALTWQGECEEAIDARRVAMAHFGVARARLRCSCRAGSNTPVAFVLVDGEGALQLDGNSYRVRPVHTSAQGSRKVEVLGYRFDSVTGSGALERTGHGRAWPPPELSAPARRELACVYAALLLYRPQR